MLFHVNIALVYYLTLFRMSSPHAPWECLAFLVEPILHIPLHLEQMSNMNPKGFVCNHLEVAETLGAFNYPKSECCNMTAPPAWFGIQICVGWVYGAHKVCSTASSTMHTYICISATQGLLYPMHAMPCWRSPGYKWICLSGATQLWSQNHCNYITLLLPLNCLAKLRSHLPDGLGWVTSCSHITAVHQVVVQVCSQP